MRLVILILAFSYLTLAQSPDEEEAVHFEGSANAPSDDEDIEQIQGSGLPIDQQYATSPVMPKMTTTVPTTTTVRESTTIYSRPTTTLVRQQKVTTYPSTTTRISTRVPGDDEASETFFAQNTVLIGMGVFIVLILIFIIVVICCCKKQKGYTPAKQTLDT